MPKSKLFSGIALLTAVALATNGVVAKPAVIANAEPTIVQLTSAHRAPATPARDATDEMTLRWMYSADGGENWSAMMDAGVTGMIDTTGAEPQAAWGAASYDFGAVVDGANNIHFAVILDQYLPGNAMNRRNGIYDVKSSADGTTVSYNLIAEETEGNDFIWSDCGINAQGHVYVIWVNAVEEAASIWGSLSTNGGTAWSQPFQIASGINIGGGTESELPYAHMTTAVGANVFYILYETVNENGTEQIVLTVPASLSGNVSSAATGIFAGNYLSYYTGAVNPISLDPNTGDVYFCIRSVDLGGTTVALQTAPGQWSSSVIPGAQRYPSVGLDIANETPWVFSNGGVGNPHRNWYAYDGLGYNGGDWTGRIMLDSVDYDGVRNLLYTNQGVWTTSGRLVYGANVWGQFTPEGFQVNYSDDGGESWAGPKKLYSIFDEEDALTGGFITQNHLLAGADNYVFVALCGKVGATDFDGPEIGEPALASFNAAAPFEVTCDLNDLNGIGYSDCNWLWQGDMALPDSLQVGWEYAEDDTAWGLDALDNGTYHFTMPNDTMQGHALAAGDSIWFFIFAQDQLNNAAQGWESLIIVGQEYQGVWEPVIIPNKTELGQNYPNPFNNSTVIPFALNASQDVKVQVWDTNGRLISTLVDGRMIAGNHQVALTTDGLSSGIYIYTLETKNERFTGKMSLLH